METATPTAPAAAAPTAATTALSQQTTTQAPQSAPPAATSASAGPATGAQADWTAGLPEELKGHIQNKQFKDVATLAESHRQLEKLYGVPQERLLKLPENMDTPEARAIWEKLGAPKDKTGYSIEIPKEAGDKEMAEWFRDVAFKSNMTQRQVEGLVGAWNERVGGFSKSQAAQSQMASTNQEQTLRTEWGAAFDQNINIAKTAVQSMQWDETKINALEGALGYDGVMKLLHQLGTATGESAFVPGRPASGGNLTPAQAKSRIDELISDSGFRQRLMAGDSDAKRQWDNVNRFAAMQS